MKESLFGDQEIIWEVLVHYRDKLPTDKIQVSWMRDAEFIIGEIHVGGHTFYTQGRSAQEFVEMVNDAIYAAYEIPVKYAKQLGGNYRLSPSMEEFNRLSNVTVKKSTIDFAPLLIPRMV
ncbi:MAG: hypothetical protein NUV84_05240 [Candidatus Uhrbacteria bacterium]|nr:hypothetical protein [Candidatus Uhrbacteria bacterium]